LLSRLAKVLYSVVLILLLSILAILLGGYLYGKRAEQRGVPRNLGNRSSTIDLLMTRKSEDEEVSFLVMGDPKGRDTFEEICNSASQDRTLDFIVILGDFCPKPVLSNHQFFISEVAERNLNIPIFLVPGNHDIFDPLDVRQARHIRPDEKPVRQDDYEKLYGARNFAFTFHNHRFIIIDNAGFSRKDWKDFLSEQLRLPDSASWKKVFAFSHKPPVKIPGQNYYDPGKRHLSKNASWLLSVTSSGVDYVFSGDFHGYYEEKRGKCTYLVTGGAGAHLKGKIYGRFHHAVKITARQDGTVAEQFLVVKRKFNPEDRFEYLSILYIYPFLKREPIVLPAAGGICALLIIFAFVGFARRLRAKNPHPVKASNLLRD